MSANTLAADVNEILTGYFLLGGKSWKGFANGKVAVDQLKVRQAALTPIEYSDQEGRAKAMATQAIAWANVNGYKGKPVTVWWTSRPGMLSAAYGQPVDSKKNPTDVLIQFED